MDEPFSIDPHLRIEALVYHALGKGRMLATLDEGSGERKLHNPWGREFHPRERGELLASKNLVGNSEKTKPRGGLCNPICTRGEPSRERR